MGKGGEKRRPIKTPLDDAVEHLGAVDDLVQLLGAFLRGGDFGLDLAPFPFDLAELVLDLQCAVGIPSVIEEENRAESAKGDDAELERIALALPLRGKFLVEEIELQGHR